MPELTSQTDRFIDELDAAVEAHMNWTRRIVRCAVLRSTPGDDVLDPHAHTLCRFGAWFSTNREQFASLDAVAVHRLEEVHRGMHDAIRSICQGVLRDEAGKPEDLDTFETTQSELIGLLATFKTLILSNAVRHDPLTELPLRYNIEHDFALYQKDAHRTGALLYVVMIDVDHFKPINDTYGHLAGDRVLRHLADVLKNTLRSNEPLYRYGGEEFLWLLKCQSEEEARKSSRRVLATIGTTPVPIDDEQLLRLTVTMGLAQVGRVEELASAIRRADFALYEGKRLGRNRYVVADPEPA
jgi:diguanylate cyclase (GGDEF)-like protein